MADRLFGVCRHGVQTSRIFIRCPPISVPAPTKKEDGTYGETSVSVPATYSEDAVYFAESRFAPDEQGRQHYQLAVRVRQTSKVGDVPATTVQEYTAELPNSSSLFCNTDLLVRVRFRKLRTDRLDMAVDVVFYGSIELDSVFGLDSK